MNQEFKVGQIVTRKELTNLLCNEELEAGLINAGQSMSASIINGRFKKFTNLQFDIQWIDEVATEGIVVAISQPTKNIAEEFIQTLVYKNILKIISDNRLIKDRIKALEYSEWNVDIFPMGSGGVGQVKEMSETIRVQIGYGTGKHNYAYAVEIPKSEIIL